MTKEKDFKEQKKKALELALSQIEKQFGKGAIMRLGEGIKLDVEVIPTGIVSLDRALGVGGLPRGRVIEIFGPEASGKTTLTLSIIAQAQAKNGIAAFVDAEHAFDPNYAKIIGVNLDELLISQPDTGEQALDIVETLVRSNAVDLIVIDSVAALVPKAEIEGEIGEAQIALQARLMSQALRKLTAAISKSKTCVIFINQLREKVGVMFGNPEITPGGRALKFYASVRIDLRKIATITDREQVIGAKVKAKIVKNKVAPPFKEAIFEILHTEGVSKIGSLIDEAIEHEIIKKSGSWLSYKDKNLAQGREQLRLLLKENENLRKELEEELNKKLYLKGAEEK
ncbi:MAG: recombinase RecA [Candidatus Omnitrophica bacterium]|nr:recombinase RecA [Candidatus Omnitrophota bacterium]MCM8831359.1 recombinase RecA [Candidatus Omnitrophota bacterium]